MTTPTMIVYLFLVFCGALYLTGIIRKYSLKYSIIDIPSERSSHTSPTPRGGGLAITLIVLITVLVSYLLQLIPVNYAIGLAGGGLLVASVGWLDDHYDIHPAWRASCYLIAAIWALAWQGGLDIINSGNHTLLINITFSLLAILFLAWLTNLYNFMDGTDALAATEAIMVGIFTGILFLMSGGKGLAIICFSIASASAGFLYWNKPPAKIFMGDVGSCFIGFMFGALALLGERTGAISIVVWIILLSIFICDATFTLFMRLKKRERWYQAHRSHAYQRLVQMNTSHGKLALYVLGLNIFIIWPVAYIAYRWQEYSVYAVLIMIYLMYITWSRIQENYDRVINESLHMSSRL